MAEGRRGPIAIRFIAKEEAMLEERFGSTYLDYKGRVRRQS